MRLKRLGKHLVEQAIELYLREAWPAGASAAAQRTVDRLHRADSLKQIREMFESPDVSEQVPLHRYTLRLGNDRYPFMKFVVQEYLVVGEYFFAVDTHDELKVTPDMADFEQWMELRRHNQDLKQRIEASWAEAGLPTYGDLRKLMEGIARCEGQTGRRGRILLVDDEVQVAQGLAAVFRARGFEVEVAFDGREVFSRLVDSKPFDLLVLDFSMPEMNGEEVIARLRSEERWRDLPVVLATASDIDLARVPSCAAYLRKPYAREMLMDLVDQLLGCQEC
ncbi:MAG: response regulator [Planctomycetota bacterium]